MIGDVILMKISEFDLTPLYAIANLQLIKASQAWLCRDTTKFQFSNEEK